MNEPDVIYEYTVLGIKASGLGYNLAASRPDFVLRHAKNSQPFARCATLEEVEKQLANIILIHNLKEHKHGKCHDDGKTALGPIDAHRGAPQGDR